MSIFLGIDTSSTDLSIGLYRDGKPFASISRYIGNSHAEHITHTLQTLLSTSGIDPEALDGVALAIGPGSFTGLRIGCAFVKGFCFGNVSPVLPVSSLHILAHAAGTHNGSVLAAIDARNGKLFRARFTIENSFVTRIADDELISSDLFYSELSDRDIIVTDTVGYRKSTIFNHLEKHATVIPVEQHPLQRGLICAAIASSTPSDNTSWSSAINIEPNYLRRSTPEERQGKKPT